MTTSEEEEERTWDRPRRQDVQRVLGQLPGGRLRPPVPGQLGDDRDLPAQWAQLVAEAEAAGPELGPALLRLLEARRQRWCRRHRQPWPLEQ